MKISGAETAVDNVCDEDATVDVDIGVWWRKSDGAGDCDCGWW